MEAALQASGRVLRENARTFNPFRDQLLQIHGGCLASDSVCRGDGHIQPLPDRLAPGQRLLGVDDQSRRHLDAVAGIATCTWATATGRSAKP